MDYSSSVCLLFLRYLWFFHPLNRCLEHALNVTGINLFSCPHPDLSWQLFLKWTNLHRTQWCALSTFFKTVAPLSWLLLSHGMLFPALGDSPFKQHLTPFPSSYLRGRLMHNCTLSGLSGIYVFLAIWPLPLSKFPCRVLELLTATSHECSAQDTRAPLKKKTSPIAYRWYVNALTPHSFLSYVKQM